MTNPTTSAALLVIGLAAAVVPAAAQPPAGPAEDPAAWDQRIDWPADCRPEDMPPEPLSVTPLEGGDGLLLATCRLHAYQATYRAWRLPGELPGELQGGDRGRTRAEPLPLLFPFLVGRGVEATLAWRPELVGLADIAGSRLTLWTRARGLGDCGELVTWELSAPLPIALAYRSRPDCPARPAEADADPARWPALSGSWLAGQRPADRSWAAAEALARLDARSPGLAWLPGSLLEADLDCDGTAEPWALGVSVGEESPAVTLLSTLGAAFGPIPVDAGVQVGLCGLDLATRVETGGRCPTLVVEDGLCDVLRLTRNPDRGLWRAERN